MLSRVYKTLLLAGFTIFVLGACSADNFENSLPMLFGINLAGAEFGETMPGEYGTDYIYPDAKELDYFKSKGLMLIRLPIRWERLQPELGKGLNIAELMLLKNFIFEAAQRDMFVLLDLHNYGRYVLNGEEIRIGSSPIKIAQIADFWTKLATEFKDYKNIWGYGIMNEPNNMTNKHQWFDIAQAIINSIRTVDNKTTIVVAGDSWSSAERWLEESDNLKNLNDSDDNMIFEAHVYFDKDASGQYLYSYDEEGASPKGGIERVKPFVGWLKENHFRGFIGEYGVPSDDPHWLVSLDKFLSYLANNCIAGAYWAAGPWWGDYDLSVEPENQKDKPQMLILEKYKIVNGESCSY